MNTTKQIRLIPVILMVMAGALLADTSANSPADKTATTFSAPAPIVPPSANWPLGEYWQGRKIGDKDFYFAANGPYWWMSTKLIAQLKQSGFYQRMIPGHFNMYKGLDSFDPAVTPTLPPLGQQLVEAFLKNKWPIQGYEYATCKGNKPASEAARKAIDDIYMGDGDGESPYRLEPVFHYIQKGRLWIGSSSDRWTEEGAREFFGNRLMPLLEKELPFIRDANHQWTRKELRKLSDIYCLEFYRKEGRVIPWGMWLSPYAVAASPECKMAVAEKGADAFANARARGMMRQSGGNKFFFTWRGWEPTTRWYYTRDAWTIGQTELNGYPLPHMWYYIFRPYLIGANYSTFEDCPGNLIRDKDDGQIELTPLGHIAMSMLDFVERHPDRGVPYAAVALLQDYNWSPAFSTKSGKYMGFNFPVFDEVDQMNHGLLNDLILPEHRHTRPGGGYSGTAPYGEIFDILLPNQPGKKIDPKIFDGYKMLFALGGLEIETDFAKTLKDYVNKGGTLVLNVSELNEQMPPEFFGVAVKPANLQAGKPDTVKGNKIIRVTDGKEFAEAQFTLRGLELKGAEALYTCAGLPVVAKYKMGEGYAILTAVPYLLQDAEVDSYEGYQRTAQPWKKRPLLNFTADLLERLTATLAPIEVRCRPEDREDISWIINKKGEGWTLALFNYSLKREEGIFKPLGVAKVMDEYPYKEVPFEIVCRAPAEDVMELYEDRDVKWAKRDGTAVVTETIKGGDIRVYEFQPRKIEMPERTRCVNYALNKPVTVSSTLEGFAPQAAVDGIRDNEAFWQSAIDAKTRTFVMPQWLQVDFGEVKTVDHVFVQFRYWPHQSLDTRLHVYKYVVEVSEDGQAWQMAMDESKNEKWSDEWGLERWIEPVKARYARLTVRHSSAKCGVQLVEFAITGPEKETYRPQRKSLIPAWQAQYPDNIKNTPPEKQIYLMDLKPQAEVQTDKMWIPAGSVWKTMNGPVTLYTDGSGEGGVYEKSIYGHAMFEAEYEIPKDCTRFVSVVGMGNYQRNSSVIFKVSVDGALKFESPLYRCGMPVLVVDVDVKGGKELKLEVTDGGDGITNDYAWWGDARFIRK